MIFSSALYVGFLLAVVLVLNRIPQGTPRKWFVLVASAVFYAKWDVRLVPLLVFLAGANYAFGCRVAAGGSPYARRNWLITGVSTDLAVLGVFKYFGFFIGSANVLLAQMGARLPIIEVILPVGISFMTFEVVSYLVDIYRGDAPRARSFVDLALLVAFFPHLIAGPILKPREFLSQLDGGLGVDARGLDRGAQLFMMGLIKKVIVADRLAPFVDAVFRDPGTFDPLTAWLATAAYGAQIYCDFSGYSDMAIGSALCLGIRIPRNFHAPYVSTSIGEFWRRWHISLSTWFRQYLYIPLGGNRRGLARQCVNLMVVMLLCGLWHGANWTFVAWGGAHGAALVVQRLAARIVRVQNPPAFVRALSWAATFLFVSAAWVVFRAPDFATASVALRKLAFVDAGGTQWLSASALVLLPVCFAAHATGARRGEHPTFSLGTFWGMLTAFLNGWLLLLGAPESPAPFIYFQF